MLKVFNNRVRAAGSLLAILAIVAFQFSGTGVKVSANNTPQTLPFSQNWTNVGLITTSDDWSAVPGIIGYRGDEMTAATGTDPRTLLVDGSTTPVDVNANQTNPDTFVTGGVSEFEITNPVVALNGSGTADAPHIVVHLNTTGFTNIQFNCNVRDIDGSTDNATQQIDVQYRVGGTGNYTSVTGGYIADATTGPSEATQVTALNLTLPAAANNQALVEVRVMTTNAVGNDENVGIDDISVTGTSGPAAPPQHILDFDGDAKTDYVLVRNTGGGPTGQITWFVRNAAGVHGAQWGIATDFFVPEDYDGDNKSDIAVYRASPLPNESAFYILQSQTGTLRIEQFGQIGDEPNVVGDYDGDGKADVAVYRNGALAGQPSTWYFRGSLNNPSGNVTYVNWGVTNDRPAPGDYDGDGKNDFVVRRIEGAQGQFWRFQTTAGIDSLLFGASSDLIVPGDYDGDGKTDVATVRGIGGQIQWFVRPSSTGAVSGGPTAVFGQAATDFPTPGDYDGDGKTDFAIWRPSADPTQNNFWVLNSSNGAATITEWGQNGDYPVANTYTH